MKKQILTLLPVFLFITTIAFAQPPVDGGWTPKDRKDFIESCIGTAKENMSVDSARHYCVCMMEKVEAKVPVAADAAKITADDLSSPEWQKLILDCLTGQWSSIERQEFMKNCVGAAKDALGSDKANSYCECMLFKIERVYPTAAEADKLTQEMLTSPSWKKKAQECLAQ